MKREGRTAQQFIDQYVVERPVDGCWPWTGTVVDHGYGVFRMGFNGPHNRAHRVAHELFIGPIPAGMDVDHLCHNADRDCPGGRACLHRRCCNPAHLEAVPRRTNLLRGRTLTAAHAEGRDCGFLGCKNCQRFHQGKAA